MWFHEQYADGLFAHLGWTARRLAKMYYLGNIKLHFDLHQQNHYSNRAWPMPCTAGETTIVIDHDGSFRSCEMRGKLGNLAEHDFNLSTALDSAQMRQEIADIPKAQCWCTHSCFIHTSTKFSPKVLLFHIPWAYLKQGWERLPEAELAEFERFRVPGPMPTAH
jgi:radical SAM protein with 4Fe4S-binding SPASM domain